MVPQLLALVLAAPGGFASADAPKGACVFVADGSHAGVPTDLQRCDGLEHCAAWDGQQGPLPSMENGNVGCQALDRLAAGGPLTLWVESALPRGGKGTACYDAMSSLDCALAFARVRCGGGTNTANGVVAQPQPVYGKPCLSVCHKIVEECNRFAEPDEGDTLLEKETVCSLSVGFGSDRDCQEVPRQSQIVKAASNALSPLAVDYADLWKDEAKFNVSAHGGGRYTWVAVLSS